MRTALMIDDNLLAEAQRLTGLDKGTDLVREALTALIERERARNQARPGGPAPGMANIPGRSGDLLAEALERIEAFSELQDDWDSYGGVKPTRQATLVALAVLLALWREGVLSSINHLDVIPVPTGGIQFEWGTVPDDVEIEIDDAGKVTWLVEGADGPGEPPALMGEVVDHVTRLVS